MDSHGNQESASPGFEEMIVPKRGSWLTPLMIFKKNMKDLTSYARCKKIPLSELHPWGRNPRTIKDKRFEALCESMTADPAFLELRPILATKEGRIYAGNMRYRAAQHLGWNEIPAIITNIPEKLARERAIKDNNEYGEWNNDELATLLDEMEKTGTDISLLGLDDSIQKIIDQLSEPEIVEDEVPEPPKEPKSKIGDLYQLGNHRLLCGDATKIDDVEKLMDGQKADMVFTDPPYGMFLDADFSTIKGSKNSFGSKHGTKGNKYDNVIGDHDDFSPDLIQTVFANFNDCREIFLFGGDYYAELLPNKNDGSWLVWDKRRQGQENAIGSEFELIWSKSKHKRRMLRHDWFGFLSSQNCSDARNRVHPTQKPISLLCDVMTQWGKDGEIVVDLYGGSGSTLIACEQLNRKCYMMEIDPRYIDVIVNRWETLTGKKSSLFSHG